mgnify:CR=1 FL=1
MDEWIAIDKVQHFMYSAFVSLGTQYVLVNKIQMDEKALVESFIECFSNPTLCKDPTPVKHKYEQRNDCIKKFKIIRKFRWTIEINC